MDCEKFDLEFVRDKFQRAVELNDVDDVLIDFYLEAFHEILKFFTLMGTIFTFVSNDVKSKVEILEKLRSNKEVDHFESVKKMIIFERDAGLLNKKDYTSGSRTLLRLHRGLDFIRNFLKRLSDLRPEEKTATVCSQSYNDTLANYHPFLIRKAAGLAMYALPLRDQLLTKVCSDVQRSIEVLPDMLKTTTVVYDRIHALYSAFDLHDLP